MSWERGVSCAVGEVRLRVSVGDTAVGTRGEKENVWETEEPWT